MTILGVNVHGIESILLPDLKWRNIVIGSAAIDKANNVFVFKSDANDYVGDSASNIAEYCVGINSILSITKRQ